MRTCWLFPRCDVVESRIQVVLPVCPKDFDLMLSNLGWHRELEERKEARAVLSLDESLSVEQRELIEQLAWDAFSEVECFVYPACPNTSWPQGPNWAFQHTARHMKPTQRPWFWMEADCVPIQPNWLEVLSQEYRRCRKPIMGVIVPGMGHCNGTAVYPSNFCDLSRKAMQCTDTAWDGIMKEETIHLTYDASNVMCHVWGIRGGQARPFGGEPAVFKSWRDVERWVNLSAVVFHRAKNTSLIERLREKIASYSL